MEVREERVVKLLVPGDDDDDDGDDDGDDDDDHSRGKGRKERLGKTDDDLIA